MPASQLSKTVWTRTPLMVAARAYTFPIAASMAAVAALSSTRNRCPYTFNVVAGLPCPSLRETVSTSSSCIDQYAGVGVAQRMETDT